MTDTAELERLRAELADEEAVHEQMRAELVRLRAIEARAAHLVDYYQLRDGTPWDSMTPEEGYKAGQAFAARYILDLIRQRPADSDEPAAVPSRTETDR